MISKGAKVYKYIIVAVDESKTSILALQQATNLAHELKAELYLIYVMDITLPSPDAAFVWLDMEKYRESHRKAALAILSSMEDKVHAAGVKVESGLIENLDHSRISDKIIEFTKKSRADLLVLGTHGRRGFHRFLIGSVAEEVVRAATIPVLLIRDASQ